MAQGELNVVHTKSSYADGISSGIVSNKEGQTYIENAIDRLEQQEKEFYGLFQASDATSFVKKIKDLFNEAPQDRAVLKRFSNAGIKDNLDTLVNTEIDVTDTYTFIVHKNPDLALQLKFDDDQTTLQFDAVFDKDSMKTELNKIYGQNRFKVGRPDMTTVTKRIKDWFSEGALEIVQSGSGENGGQVYEDVHKLFLKGYPWNYTKKELDLFFADEGSEGLTNGLNEAKQRIRDMILGQMAAGASDDLQNALRTVYEKRLGEKDPMYFFEKGGNWYKGIIGALGEFQNAVWLEYLSIKLGRAGIGKEAFVEVTGNETEDGVLPRIDVLFGKFGFNTKNFDLDKVREEQYSYNIDLYSTPKEIVSRGAAAADFLTYIANAYFNESNQGTMDESLEQVQMKLAEKYADLMNLGYSDSVTGVNFFLLGGERFVPASEALAAVAEETSSYSVRITYSGTSGRDDSYFNRENGEFIRSRDKTAGPTFLYYWQNSGGRGSWYPVDRYEKYGNSRDFNKTLNAIRIHYDIKAKAILPVGYSLFG